jgi:hypothetical protein
MFQASFGSYKIEIIDEKGYAVGSTDNKFHYDLEYQHPEDIDDVPISTCGIRVYKNRIYKTAVVMARGGGTRVEQDSGLIDGQNLLLTCCNKVFCFQLPDLRLNWVIIADMATCFSIYQYHDSYIVHGETEITRLDQSGKIIWQIGARDIFVNTDHYGPTFKMHDEHIELMDWQGYRYKLFYNGVIVDDGMAGNFKNVR